MKTVYKNDITMNPSGFVLLADAVPHIVQEIRYYSTYNFIGERIDGYEEPCALLTREAARALKASDTASTICCRPSLPFEFSVIVIRFAEENRMKDIELSLNDLDSVSGGATGGSVLELRLFPVRHRYGAEHPRGLERGEGHHGREDAGGTGLLPVIQPEQHRDAQRRGADRERRRLSRKKRGGELQRAQPDRVPAGKLLHPESLGHGAAQRSLAFQRQLQRRGSGRHPGIGDGRRLTAFTAALCVSVH